MKNIKYVCLRKLYIKMCGKNVSYVDHKLYIRNSKEGVNGECKCVYV